MNIYKTPRFIRLLAKRITWGFSPSNKTVFLTFDDGPDPSITPWILDELRKYNWKATFFCVGENVQKHPEIYQRILTEGHQVGNHTMHHENALKTPPKVYLKSISEAKNQIDSTLFRPPYGKLTPTLYRKIQQNYQIVLWSYMTYDFDFSIPTETIIQKFEKGFKDGDIIVLHDNPKFLERQKDIFPAIIKILHDRGFRSDVIQLKKA